MTSLAIETRTGSVRSDYADFLAAKRAASAPVGRDCGPADVHPYLYDWQAELVAWAVRTGRAAIWADTGLGKTLMQLEWARLSGARVLIVAPLAVCHQTACEAKKIGVHALYARDDSEAEGPGVWITNYERVAGFDPTRLDAVVLDEASILKQSDGRTRTLLIEHFAPVPHRLTCTATPAPNDPEELTNQAEFLGRMRRVDMLAAYFIHDQDGWRLKGHARRPMLRWMASWAVALRSPADLGYPADGYRLPGLRILPHLLAVDAVPEGQLFATDLGGVGGRAKVRRSTLNARVDRSVQLVRDCGSQGVQQGVLPGEQGEVEAFPGGTGTAQCTPAEAVRGGQGSPRRGPSGFEEVSAEASASAPSGDLRPDAGRDRVDARPGLSGLPREPARGLDGADAYRPRSQDGHGPWCSLSTVQPGGGASERRPDQGHGALRLPHACIDQWVIWCGLNDEQDALSKALGDECRSIDGRTPLEERVEINEAWKRGEFRILLVKPGMFSQGMNWQHCARMVFVGLSDSYEQYYQAVRRCYRYGQARVVDAHIVLSDLESQIAANVAAKEREAGRFTAALVTEMRSLRQEIEI